MVENLDSYNSVLADLKAERDDLDKLISALEAKVAARRIKPFTILRPPSLFATSSPDSDKINAALRAAADQRPVTLYDGSEKILQETGTPMHVKALVHQLKERYDRKTSARSLAGSLPQDPKKRFERVGPNIFALAEWKQKNDGT